MKKSQTPRFEVDFKQRLEQQRTATDAVRLPRLGYKQYRIYEDEPKKDKVALNSQYGNLVSSARSSSYLTLWNIIFDELSPKSEPRYKVKWLKEKQATLLRLKGHRVELTTPDDQSTVGLVRLGA